jgi:pyruvate formate lyase activating enzyme
MMDRSFLTESKAEVPEAGGVVTSSKPAQSDNSAAADPHGLKVPVALRKTSLVDFPGKTAAVIFFPFCNLRCPWCHNGALITQSGGGQTLIPLSEALALIEKRRKVLGGVVLSGGEPTLYSKLPELIVYIKDLGLSVKVDTNGTNPDMIKEILTPDQWCIDYIALDLKIHPRRCAQLEIFAPPQRNGECSIIERLIESAALIRESGIPCEMRSLALPAGQFTQADIKGLALLAGAAPWHIRAFRPGNCLDPAWNDYPPTSDAELAVLVEAARRIVAALVPKAIPYRKARA